jgi:hypothetical protein
MNLMGVKKVRMTVYPNRFEVVSKRGRKLSTGSHRRGFIRNRLLSAGFNSIHVSVKS